MKKNKNSKRKKHYIGNRADYRTGGRVKLHVGAGAVHEREQGIFIPHNPSLPSHDTTYVGGVGGGPGSGGGKAGSSGPAVGETRTNDDGTISIWNGSAWVKQGTGAGEYNPSDQETFEDKRGKRIIKAGDDAVALASGEQKAYIPEQEVATIKRGDDSTALQLDKRTGVTADTIATAGSESVERAGTTTAAADADIKVSTMDAAQIADSPDIKTAQGTLDSDELAKAAGVEDTDPTQTATVEVVDGALAEVVTGSISEGAKATAVKNAGTNLARITRAKKQLTSAGLSSDDIAAIGNDPEDLEARLEDYSEEERGIIAGLPEEALISTQINGLLEGMEDGNIPVWARPAVSKVEQMLAQRGLSASTVGRDNLFNAIIQAAMPIAQSNAQAIQASVSQQKSIEAQAAEANAARGQQTALSNANTVFQMDMANFSAEQQTTLSNSKFLQTVSLTNATMEQQGTMQDTAIMAQSNLAEADFYQKAQIQNAQAFLTMDMANLSNEQQSFMLKGQQEQQRLLSNQSATNASRQFNAASENQTQQFMANLKTQVNQFNAQQTNVTAQFNAQSANAAEARRLANIADVNKSNAAILNQTKQFNESVDFQRTQFNLQNAQAIEQSNVSWRRKANLADTAAQNAVNQQNAQNAFGIAASAQNFLWQELRDQADYDFRWATDSATRKTNAMIAAASAEGDAASTWSTNFDKASSVLDRIFGG